MALKLAEKKAIISAIAEKMSNSLSVGVAEHTNLNVTQVTKFRKQARDMGIHIQVTRNKLAKIAVKGTPFEGVSDSLKGPSILAFSNKEMNAVPLLFKEFIKSNDNFKILNLSIPGASFSSDKLGMLCSLPTLHEARSSLSRSFIAPVMQICSTLNDIPKKMLRILTKIQEQKTLS